MHYVRACIMCACVCMHNVCVRMHYVCALCAQAHPCVCTPAYVHHVHGRFSTRISCVWVRLHILASIHVVVYKMLAFIHAGRYTCLRVYICFRVFMLACIQKHGYQICVHKRIMCVLIHMHHIFVFVYTHQHHVCLYTPYASHVCLFIHTRALPVCIYTHSSHVYMLACLHAVVYTFWRVYMLACLLAEAGVYTQIRIRYVCVHQFVYTHTGITYLYVCTHTRIACLHLRITYVCKHIRVSRVCIHTCNICIHACVYTCWRWRVYTQKQLTRIRCVYTHTYHIFVCKYKRASRVCVCTHIHHTYTCRCVIIL